MINQLYFNKLDHLRFYAFFLVFWQHGFSNSFSQISDNSTLQTIVNSLTITGGIGVHIFFVISGFLITFLMLKEEYIEGKLNIAYFYIRRFLRIWPLYYFILILGIFVLPNLINTFKFKGDLLKNLLFLNNFDVRHGTTNVEVTWSIAIEEQFYLFWPIVFVILKNKKALLLFILFSFIMSTLFIIRNPYESYFHTFGNINYLMTGCFGGWIFFKYNKQLLNSSLMKSKNIYFAIIILFLFVIMKDFSQLIYLTSLVGLPLLYLYTIMNLALNSSNKITLISKFGKYTYGMYLYHPLIIIFVKISFDLLKFDYIENRYINFVAAIVALLLTILLSYVSYEYFERIILNFKSRFSFVKTRV